MKNTIKFVSLKNLYDKTFEYEILLKNLKMTTFYLEQYCTVGGQENIEKARYFASQAEIAKRKLQGLDNRTRKE
jgi:hypothetical protein